MQICKNCGESLHSLLYAAGDGQFHCPWCNACLTNTQEEAKAILTEPPKPKYETYSAQVRCREITNDEAVRFIERERGMGGWRLIEVGRPGGNVFVGVAHPHSAYCGLEKHEDSLS